MRVAASLVVELPGKEPIRLTEGEAQHLLASLRDVVGTRGASQAIEKLERQLARADDLPVELSGVETGAVAVALAGDEALTVSLTRLRHAAR